LSEKKLEENFVETDRRAICQIPLGRFADDDWAWTQEKNGLFSVRSAYRLISSIRHASQPSGSRVDYTYWKKLWKLPVHPKVRCSWWRVMKKYVPAK
jgi:hypothetical protein